MLIFAFYHNRYYGPEGVTTLLITPKKSWDEDRCMGEMSKENYKTLEPVIKRFNLAELIEGEFAIPKGTDRKALRDELEDLGIQFHKEFHKKIRRRNVDY